MLDTNQEHINMKKILFALFAVLTLLTLSSCESEPQVTACQEQTADEPEYGTDYWGNVVFRGTKKVAKVGYIGMTIKNALTKMATLSES